MTDPTTPPRPVNEARDALLERAAWLKQKGHDQAVTMANLDNLIALARDDLAARVSALEAAARFMLDLVEEVYGTDHEPDPANLNDAGAYEAEAAFRKHRSVIRAIAEPPHPGAGGAVDVIVDGSPHTPLQGGTDRGVARARAGRGFRGAVRSAVVPSMTPLVKPPPVKGYER